MKKHDPLAALLTTTVASTAATLAMLTATEAEALPPGVQAITNQAANNAQPSDEEAMRKYFDFGYNYCDAKVLGAFWGEADPGQAKLVMGHKLLALGGDDGEWIMRQARGEALKKVFPNMACDYQDGGYTYNDAEALGRYWGKGTWESKATMTELLVAGQEDVLKAALRSANGGR